MQINFKCTCRVKFKNVPPRIIASPFNIVEQEDRTIACSSTIAFFSINLPSALNINESFLQIKSRWSCLVLNSQKSPVKPSAQEHSNIKWGFSTIWIRFSRNWPEYLLEKLSNTYHHSDMDYHRKQQAYHNFHRDIVRLHFLDCIDRFVRYMFHHCNKVYRSHRRELDKFHQYRLNCHIRRLSTCL